MTQDWNLMNDKQEQDRDKQQSATDKPQPEQRGSNGQPKRFARRGVEKKG